MSVRSIRTEYGFDLIIVGSGLSCCYTLLALLEELKSRCVARTVSIAVIEKDATFWTGVSCGTRSSFNSLMITNLDDFLPPEDKDGFLSWLDKLNWKEAIAQGGDLAVRWFERNCNLIERKEWGSIFLPRQLFGDYTRAKVADAIVAARANGVARVSQIPGEAIQARRRDASWELIINAGTGTQTLASYAVVLAVGSPQYSSLEPFTDGQASSAVIVDHPYEPSITCNLSRINKALSTAPAGKRNILVVGSNATALEVMYHLASNSSEALDQLVIISRGGTLPEPLGKSDSCDPYPEHLAATRHKADLQARDIMDALFKDLEVFRERDRSGLSHIVHLVPELTKLLPTSEQVLFQNRWGSAFTKLIRRAGHEYLDVPQRLLAEGKLSICKGELVLLKSTCDAFACAQYVGSNEQLFTHPTPFPVVVNCRGFEEPSIRSNSKIIRDLISKGLCTVNASGRGFRVNEQLEASERLYVVGPLLAGAYTDRLRGWHFETARRIRPAAALLAQHLGQVLLAS